MEDWKEKQRVADQYERDRLKSEHDWEIQSTIIKTGIQKGLAVFTQKLQDDSKKAMDAYDQKMGAFLNDKDWGASMAFLHMHGRVEWPMPSGTWLIG
ncbi:MAG: hypothetical protein MZV63_15565 [Marinilabiliales bacterium]|nr:hypothetical protein [Marinilabiliales bacterium]